MNFTIKSIKTKYDKYNLSIKVRDDEMLVVGLSDYDGDIDILKPYQPIAKYDLLLRDSEYPVYIRHFLDDYIKEITIVFDEDKSNTEYTIYASAAVVNDSYSISNELDKICQVYKDSFSRIDKIKFTNISLNYEFGIKNPRITRASETIDISEIADSYESSIIANQKEYIVNIIIDRVTKREFKFFLPSDADLIDISTIEFTIDDKSYYLSSRVLNTIISDRLIAIDISRKVIINAPLNEVE